MTHVFDEFKNCVGKTISVVSDLCNDRLVIVFTDNTYSMLKVEKEDDYYCSIEDVYNPPNYHWLYVKTGIQTEEEFNNVLMAERQRSQKLQEEYDRSQYEKLKKKFES